jgi:ubiquinone/menaquinone biosynthesis C-methylase UbiE
LSKTNLGLPFEYQQYPEYFDAMNIDASTAQKNALIERILKKCKVHTVLDMTCGTGSQVFYLANKGYQVLGSDFSPELLKQARKKSRHEKMQIKFIDGDMRNIKINKKFDAVITIFNAIGHLTKAGFEKSLKNIHHHLNDNGVYIFDILNPNAMTDKVVADLSCHRQYKIKDSQIFASQCSTLDKKNGQLTSYNQCMIQHKNNKPTLFNEHYTMQIYAAKELKNILSRNGFELVLQYDMHNGNKATEKTLSVLTIARKI